MRPFLKQVAEYYYGAGRIEESCFIFPNRRSMAFFTKYLTEAVARTENGVPVIAPQMMTINDFFYKVADARSVDKVRLLLYLYESYIKVFAARCTKGALKPESLDEFIFWGDIILGDFNDIDKYLVDPAQLFANVADLKQIQDTFSYLTPTQRKAIEGFVSHFSDKSGRLTVNLDSDDPNVKERFLLIWNLLYDLYADFNERLGGKGLAYEGMVYRKTALRIKEEGTEDVFNEAFPGTERFVFVGLNALNECEKTLLRKLRDAGKAEFCWDYSGKLISDRQNRSSVFMSENVVEFPQVTRWDADGVGLPQINVVSVPSSVGQAKRLPDILGEVADSSDLVNTAIVLPDENLLVPVLNSIPETISDINVTMGLPMTGSLLYSLMNDVAAVQLHTVNRRGQWYFYHKQVWDLFSNDLFRKAADEQTLKVVAKVKSEARYYIPQSDLSGTALLDAVFRAVVTDQKAAKREQIASFARYQKDVITTLAPMVASDGRLALELEYAKHYYTCINVLDEIGLEVLPLTYVRLLGQLLSSVSVPFKGEPLKGLQIMGPLETRALDFRNLIVLSANEGVFPRRSVSSSFIPPELRKGFGLPTYEYQDAVWAYYFYRMISRAENVWLLTDSRTEGLKSGEESRYIKQLEYHFNLPVRRFVVKFDKMKTASVPEIVKTAEDVEKIKARRLSASSVQNYLACPAKFYYNSVEGLQLEEEVAESLDYGTFGTVFHETMRSIYTSEEAMAEDFFFDDKGCSVAPGNVLKTITREYIERWAADADGIRRKIKSLIMNLLNTIEISGRNLVVTDVILRYVIRTLKCDLEIMDKEGVDSFEVLGREVYVSGEFHGQMFHGYVDRIDSFHKGQIRVVDYKTGKVLKDDEEIHDGNAEAIAQKIFLPDVKDRPKIALQFYIYDLLLKDRPEYKGLDIYNCVYSTAKLFKETPEARLMSPVFFDAVSENMKAMLDEMYDTEVPFRRTEDTSVCEYCDFKMICGR